MQEVIHNFLNWNVLRISLPFLASGLLMTLKVSGVSMVVALLIGILVATLRFLNSKVVNLLLVAYVDVFRAMPPLVLVIFVFFALPYLGIQLPPFLAVVISLSLYTGAYNAEIIRGGIEAVPSGQTDAARSLGMSYGQLMRYVVLPQAYRIAIPPLTNHAVGLVKLTPLAFVVALPELLNMSRWAQTLTANSTPLLAAAVIYLVLLLSLSRLSGWIELRLRRESPGVREVPA